MPISILIRTFNSAKTLGKVLEAIRLQEGDEYIVVDSGSTDATLEIARAHGAKIIQAPPPFNYSKSLNLGFTAACNPWVLVISSHSIPAVSGFLEIYRREAAAFPKDVVAAYGPSTFSGKADPRRDNRQTTLHGSTDHPVCSNSNALYRREAWEQLHFDEGIRTAEDLLWLIEIVRRGYRFAYVPAARTTYHNQGTLPYMFRKGYYESRILRGPDFHPMSLYCLGGAFKNLTKQRLLGEIDSSNWLRGCAHDLGQFFGSHQSQDNTPRNGAS